MHDRHMVSSQTGQVFEHPEQTISLHRLQQEEQSSQKFSSHELHQYESPSGIVYPHP